MVANKHRLTILFVVWCRILLSTGQWEIVDKPFINAQDVPMNWLMRISAYAPPPMSQPQYFYKPLAMTVGVVPSSCPAGPPLCTLTKGAEVRCTPTGAVSIPPSPPGCAPNVQLAAMQGLPVLLQKKKRSFF